MPQEGSLQEHLVQYRKHIDELIPNTNNSGLIIIDFESWRPIFRQNWGVLSSYKEVSYQIEHERHPFWTKQRYETEVDTYTQDTVLYSSHVRLTNRFFLFFILFSISINFTFLGGKTFRSCRQRVCSKDDTIIKTSKAKCYVGILRLSLLL